MNTSTVRSVLKVAFVLAGLYCSASSHAIIASIDEFWVDVNGSNFYSDFFDNNQTPSQETGTYRVQGAFPNGAESGGLLTLNSAWGALGTNALGGARQTLGANLTGAANENIGTLEVGGIFNLATPTGPLNNGYGIRVYDVFPNQPSDSVLQMLVQYWAPTSSDIIRFVLQDFANGTITDLGLAPFAPGINDTQIALLISRPSASSNNFFGGYAYGSGGNWGALVNFGTPGTMFTNGNSLGAGFQAFSTVPEPATLALLSLALAGLAASRRRKQ